jgi:protein involved in polysaccharide export with SLBB domain
MKNKQHLSHMVISRHILSYLILAFTLTSCASKEVLVPSITISEPSFRSTIGMASRKNQNNNINANSQTTMATGRALFNIPILSPGDKIQVDIHEGEDFSGVYSIDVDGCLKLPYLKPIHAQGLNINDLKAAIHKVLLLEDIFKKEFINISITPIQWSASLVNVKGAVYKPGNTLINQRTKEEYLNPIKSDSGDFANKKLLSSALKAAGGVKPDADLDNIQLVRNNVSQIFNMSGILSGDNFTDPVLTTGDLIIVPSTGYMQKTLLRPSRITPPGFRVFLSNLTVPASSNNSSAIGKYASNLPLGSRLLTAAISANCVGGTTSVNAKRFVILVGNDTQTNVNRTMKRSISELLNMPNSDKTNPYLMPNDMIACFDSNMTNWRDLGRAFADILSPAMILRGGL